MRLTKEDVYNSVVTGMHEDYGLLVKSGTNEMGQEYKVFCREDVVTCLVDYKVVDKYSICRKEVK